MIFFLWKIKNRTFYKNQKIMEEEPRLRNQTDCASGAEHSSGPMFWYFGLNLKIPILDLSTCLFNQLDQYLRPNPINNNQTYFHDSIILKRHMHKHKHYMTNNTSTTTISTNKKPYKIFTITIFLVILWVT